MNHWLLKSLIGKHLSAAHRALYIHVSYVVNVEGNAAIVSVITKTRNGKTFHWFVEAAWSTDHRGFHNITDCKIIREDELYAEHTPENAIV